MEGGSTQNAHAVRAAVGTVPGLVNLTRMALNASQCMHSHCSAPTGLRAATSWRHFCSRLVGHGPAMDCGPAISCPPTSWTHLPRSLAPFKVQNSFRFSPAPVPSSLSSPSVGCLARAGIAEVLDAHLHDYSRQVAATRGSQAALQASLDRVEVCRPCQVHADAVLAPLCIVWDHSTHRPRPCAAAG